MESSRRFQGLAFNVRLPGHRFFRFFFRSRSLSLLSSLLLLLQVPGGRFFRPFRLIVHPNHHGPFLKCRTNKVYRLRMTLDTQTSRHGRFAQPDGGPFRRRFRSLSSSSLLRSLLLLLLLVFFVGQVQTSKPFFFPKFLIFPSLDFRTGDRTLVPHYRRYVIH